MHPISQLWSKVLDLKHEKDKARTYLQTPLPLPEFVIYDVLFVRLCGDVDRLSDVCLPGEINVEN